MAFLMEALCNVPALKVLDVSDGARQIVRGVNASLEWWEVILHQDEEHMDRRSCRYDTWLWPKPQMRYDMGKHDCHRLMKALRRFRNYVYGCWHGI